MPREWFYAVENEQKGPVGARDLVALERDGRLDPRSLVWTEGLPAWQPWADLAPRVRDEAAAESGPEPGDENRVRCAFSGEEHPRSEMIRYGEHFVALEHKDAFLQALREGHVAAALPGTGILQFVGFWWRVLASVIDWAVKLLPSLACFLPYWYMKLDRLFARGVPAPTQPIRPFEEFTQEGGGALLLAYVGGLLVYTGLSVFYDTWMVGKYGGTVGKLALNFRVVNADGSRVSYGRAFGRWAAETLGKLIWFGPASVGYFLGMLGFPTPVAGSPPEIPSGFLVAMALSCIWYVIGGFPYYMAGWTREKKALHDFMCGTRVIRRQLTQSPR